MSLRLKKKWIHLCYLSILIKDEIIIKSLVNIIFLILITSWYSRTITLPRLNHIFSLELMEIIFTKGENVKLIDCEKNFIRFSLFIISNYTRNSMKVCSSFHRRYIFKSNFNGNVCRVHFVNRVMRGIKKELDRLKMSSSRGIVS